MGKQRVADFDPSVCMGEHPEVSGPCPHLEANDADTGRGLIDRLRGIEMSVLNSISSPQEGACGACGCPLVNLAALDYAPDECPRLHLHNR